MRVDVARAIGAMTRELKSGEREGKPTRSMLVRRTYSTDISDLWDAVSNEERIARWFAPVTGQLKLGGRYQIQDNAGGTITACEPPRLIEVTWEFGGSTSWVTVMLEPIGPDETLLTLEHLVLVDPHYEKYGPGAVGVGWELSLIGLESHLAGGAVISASESADWSISEQGRVFAQASSNGWRQAAIAGGDLPEQATAAAERTRAFYSGELVPEG